MIVLLNGVSKVSPALGKVREQLTPPRIGLIWNSDLPPYSPQNRGCEYLLYSHSPVKKSMHVNSPWSMIHLHGLALTTGNKLYNCYYILTFDSI